MFLQSRYFKSIHLKEGKRLIFRLLTFGTSKYLHYTGQKDAYTFIRTPHIYFSKQEAPCVRAYNFEIDLMFIGLSILYTVPYTNSRQCDVD